MYKLDTTKNRTARIATYRIVHIELDRTDHSGAAHKEIRSIFFPLPYEDSSRAVIGVK